jgi:Uncharacterized conserved protein (DUF2039)
MPTQSSSKQGGGGRKPAHQNTFAFRHNPHSKKTLVILNSPNVHVCRRCHDKIEWRKQYRKYKPLTQPSKCNHCEKRNVLAAYHTICTKCSTSSSKSKALLEEWNNNKDRSKKDSNIHHNDDDNDDGSEDQAQEQRANESQAAAVVNVEKEGGLPSEQDTGSNKEDADKNDNEGGQRVVHRRVCAMCVKEPALPCADDEDDDDESSRLYAADGRKLKLREVKALQRKRLQEKRSKKKKSTTSSQQDDDDENDDDDNDDEGSDSNQHADVTPATVPSKAGTGKTHHDDCNTDDDDDDEDDPFLRAVGGADKLLTGEAYQQMLLQKASSKLQTSS